MSYLSHPVAAVTIAQPENDATAQVDKTVYKFRLTGWAWILIYQSLVMAMPLLKLLHLTGVSSWSWLWVTMPIWGPAALLAIVLVAEQLGKLAKLAKPTVAVPQVASSPVFSHS